MQLTSEAVEAIKENIDCRNRLAYELHIHSGTLDRQLKENLEDGPLTKAKALHIISEETKITKSKLLIS